MKRFWFIALLLAVPVFAQEKVRKEQENFFLTQSQHSIVPKVNPVTGEYCEEELDFVVAGVAPLSVRRFYNHLAPYDPKYASWRYNPETFCAANLEYGLTQLFSAVGYADGSVCSFDPSAPYTFRFGSQNSLTHFQPSGQTHPLNTKISYSKYGDPKRGDRFQYFGQIIDGCGGCRTFCTDMHDWVTITRSVKKEGFKLEAELIYPSVWTPYQLPIVEEKLPSGLILCYSYTPWKKEEEYPRPRLLSKIVAYNGSKTKELGSITFHYPRDKRNNVSGVNIYGSDGRHAFLGHMGKPQILLGSATRPGTPPVHYGFNAGRLSHVVKPDGRVLETHYNAEGKVSTQNAPVGPDGQICYIAWYTYAPNSTSVRDAEDNTTVYHFDDKKRITAIEMPDGSATRFTWDSATGNLLQKSIADTQITEYKYDKNQNPICETTNGRSIHRTFSDDGFNLKLTETDRAGKLVCYSYVPGTNLLAQEVVYEGDTARLTTTYEYDDCAICIQKTVDDGITCKVTKITPRYELPCFGLPEIVDEGPLGKVVYSYTPFGQVAREEHFDGEGTYRFSIVNEYDKEERLIATTDALGQTTRYTYDANYNLTTISGPMEHQEIVYDKANRPIRHSHGALVNEKRYDKLGRVVEEIDPCGFATSYTYDCMGRHTSTLYADGAIERKEYDTLGNVIKEIDANGFETRKSYNPFGQVTDIFHPDGSEEHFVYNPTGTLAAHTDRNGATTCYTYDIFDHVIHTKKLHGTSSTWSALHKLSETDEMGVQTTYAYDALGRLISEEKAGRKTLYFYDALGRQCATQTGDTITIEEHDLLGRVIEKRIEVAGRILFQENYAYDANGNKTEVVTCAAATITRYNDHNQPLSITTPDGHTTTYVYDHRGPYSVTTINPLGLCTVEEHDCRGRPSKRTLKNAAGELLHRAGKTYDPAGNLLESQEEALVTSRTYGPGGRIESLTEAGQKTTRYLYDACGRLKTVIKPDGSQIHHAYDTLGRLSQYGHYSYVYDPKGRIIEVDDGKTITTRIYNAHDQIVEEQLANGLTVKSSFDDQGRRTTLVLPDGSRAHYTYLGPYLHTVSRGGGTYTYAERNLAGKPTLNVFPLGTLSITWDQALRWKEIDTPLYKASYVYDPLGNLISSITQDPLGSEAKTFIYDDLSQLIKENTHTYAYDTLYNRTAKDAASYALSPLSQVVNDGKKSYEYDPNGNLLSDGSASYEYDLYDRLIAVTKNGKRTTYTYDPFNRRIAKDKELYIWDGKNEIGMMQSGRTYELRILGEGLGAEIGSAVIFELYGYTYFPIHDIQGSLATMLYAKNYPYGTFRYTAFGEPLTRDTTSPWRFASKRHDKETDLIYFGRRYYCPTLGRWITADPQGFDDGPNLYAYVHNNPFSLLDLHGLYSCRNVWGGTKDFFYGVGSHFWGGIQCAGYGLGKMGEWMYADFQYEYFNDRSFFEQKSYQAGEGWRNFGQAIRNDPLGSVFPGIMEAWRHPTSPAAWGKATVDVALIGLPVAKLGNAARLGRVGRIGEEFATLGKAGGIAKEMLVSPSTSLKPLGLGSTGRTTALSLTEQVAMKEIMSNPNLGKVVMSNLNDPRWPGWSKMQHTRIHSDGTRVNIHYVAKWENEVLKAVDDFKFK